jgi:hypothetical protein
LLEPLPSNDRCLKSHTLATVVSVGVTILPWANMPPYLLILSYSPHICLPSGLFPSGFLAKVSYVFCMSLMGRERHISSSFISSFCDVWLRI